MKKSVPSVHHRYFIREIFLLCSLYLLPGLLSTIINHEASLPPSGDILTSVFTLLLLSGLVIHILETPAPEREAEVIPIGNSTVLSALGSGIILAVGLLILSSAIGFLFDALLPAGAPPETTPLTGNVSDVPVVLLTLLAVTAGISEEIIFRLYLLRRLRTVGLKQPASVLISAGLFAVGHLYQGISATFFALVAGVFLGVLWYRSPNLLRFAFAHGLYNVTVLLISSLNSVPSSL